MHVKKTWEASQTNFFKWGGEFFHSCWAHKTTRIPSAFLCAVSQTVQHTELLMKLPFLLTLLDDHLHYVMSSRRFHETQILLHKTLNRQREAENMIDLLNFNFIWNCVTCTAIHCPSCKPLCASAFWLNTVRSFKRGRFGDRSTQWTSRLPWIESVWNCLPNLELCKICGRCNANISDYINCICSSRTGFLYFIMLWSNIEQKKKLKWKIIMYREINEKGKRLRNGNPSISCHTGTKWKTAWLWCW